MKIEITDFINSEFLELAESEFIYNKKRTGPILKHFPFLKKKRVLKIS